MESPTDKIFIGIDPGKTGAISYIYPGGWIDSGTFPLIAKEYDIRSMRTIFKYIAAVNCHVVLEDVKALQKPFQAGNWNLSRGKAIIETLLIIYDIPHTLVHSKTWQKEMWQGVPQMRGPSKNGKKGSILTKEMSLVAVKRLFPQADLRNPDRKTDRSVKPHDGVVDSILMAGYCCRKFK
jgi:hypothetical protein